MYSEIDFRLSAWVPVVIFSAERSLASPESRSVPTVVKPNRDHYRPVGAYAAAVRKRGRVPGARGEAGSAGDELDVTRDRTS